MHSTAECARHSLGGTAEVTVDVAPRLSAAAVRRARVAGLTWSEIADSLGVAKEAAHRKDRGR